ncbi:ADP-ribose pyrophosphatase YjhB (NUDIX family) [Luteococcus japonicus]|uniref:ADP-ribose pyrophosphatase YjhB (NUDIX family) n=1 Tax=Luteococcus japonicus TaxID=33984 RepID=A0A3N1ZQ52_9ACTN|nr:NUDIX hydrolase [Luteococcus japonicus]ROR53031.1 ADP-ribose pyrophosphatase YjhB (NUDIX family) [Luteococcus japonicus]
MEAEFTVQVQVSGDVGVVMWSGATDAGTLARAVSMASDDILLGHEVRRLEVSVPATDQMARRALHLAGFRREGIRRHAMSVDEGQFVDVHQYSRLSGDVVYGPEGFSGVMDSVLPMKRLIAHAVFRNPSGQVLLLQTTYKSDWELPGGVVEPGEPPRVGAEREIAEELGLSVLLGAPAVVDWMPPSLGWSDALEFIYDGGVLGQVAIESLVREELEIHSIHWVDPADVPHHVSPLSARRIALVLDDFTGFTEDGVPIG